MDMKKKRITAEAEVEAIVQEVGSEEVVPEVVAEIAQDLMKSDHNIEACRIKLPICSVPFFLFDAWVREKNAQRHCRERPHQ